MCIRDRYYNDHVKMGIIRRLQEVKTWNELMGIQSAVLEAIDNERLKDAKEKIEFEKWKASQEEIKK